MRLGGYDFVPEWMRACENRDLAALKTAITDSNINTQFDIEPPLGEAVARYWHEAASWLISRGASLYYIDRNAQICSVMSLTGDMAMVRLLGLNVHSPCFISGGNYGCSQTRLCHILEHRADQYFESFIIELIDAGAQLSHVTAHGIAIPQWVQQLADGRERCRHVVMLLLMHRASERRDIMRLIAREVWDTRLETKVWCD